MNKFGPKLRALRGQRNMTLKEMAHALGYNTHSHISAIEHGHKEPTVEFVLKVAQLFDVTTDQLLKDELNLPANDGLDVEE